MSEQSNVAIAEATEESAVTTNISASEFALRRLEASEAVSQPPEDVSAEETMPPEEGLESLESEAEGFESGETGLESEAEESNVLSKLNLDIDQMSREETDALAKALNSRSLDRFGKLTARAKAAEEALAKLQEKSPEADPLASTPEPTENPFSDINTLDGLKAKAREVEGLIEWAEDVMDDSSHLDSDDEAIVVDGRSMTKKEVKASLKNARKSRKEYLPGQLQNLKNTAQVESNKASVAKKAEIDFPWLADENSELRTRYAQIAGSPDMRKAYESSPELAVRLPYLIAAAVDRMNDSKSSGQKTAPRKAKSIPLVPPSSPSSASAPPVSGDNSASKILNDLDSRFKKSGRTQDFIKLRTLKHQ